MRKDIAILCSSLAASLCVGPSLEEACAQDLNVSLGALDLRATQVQIRPDGTRTSANWERAVNPELKIEKVIVRDGQSLSQMLAAKGIRPDDYSIDVVKRLNGLESSDLIRVDQELLMLDFAGVALGHGEQIAIQPFREDREQTENSLSKLMTFAKETGSSELVTTTQSALNLYAVKRVLDPREVRMQADQAAATLDFVERSWEADPIAAANRLIAFTNKSASYGAKAQQQLLRVDLIWDTPPAPGKCMIIVATETMWRNDERRTIEYLPLASGAIEVKTPNAVDVWVQRSDRPIALPMQPALKTVDYETWREANYVLRYRPPESCQ